MKLKNIKKLGEPLVYITLVAAFGFITSIVNHSQGQEPVSDAQLMSFSIEQQLDAMLTGKTAVSKEISL